MLHVIIFIFPLLLHIFPPEGDFLFWHTHIMWETKHWFLIPAFKGNRIKWKIKHWFPGALWVSGTALTVLHQNQSTHPPSSGPAKGLFFPSVLTVSIRGSWRQKAVISHHHTRVHSWFSIMPVCQCYIFSHTQNRESREHLWQPSTLAMAGNKTQRKSQSLHDLWPDVCPAPGGISLVSYHYDFPPKWKYTAAMIQPLSTW